MRTVEDYERIRKAYYNENLSIRAINRKYGYSRRLIRKAILDPEPRPYKERPNKGGKILGPYEERIKELLAESEKQPRKQRYTARNIYELIQSEGYRGSEGGVHNFISRYRKNIKARKTYLPLEFEPGEDAQVDWGEAVVELAGKRQKIQFFAMRLNYSRTRFVMAFPFQKQEAFLAGHVEAFRFYGGIPRRITYDNLKTAVYKVLEGHNREEQKAFQVFRSYYLFDSHYCNPAQGHEKGGIENDVGYLQRNFFSPIPKFESFTALNEYLLQRCQDDVHRQIRGQKYPVAELWEIDKANMLPLPGKPYPACKNKPVKANPYSQVTYETNRYSVPIPFSGKQLMLRAYPFRIEIIHQEKIIAQHQRCFEREQDIYDPLHYLALLEQRPGAFYHAAPVKKWRQEWPKAYESLLQNIQEQENTQKGLQDFIAILKLHQQYPPETVSQAIQAAVMAQMPSLDGVLYQLGLLVENKPQKRKMDLKDFPQFQQYHPQPVDLKAYDQLLGANT